MRGPPECFSGLCVSVDSATIEHMFESLPALSQADSVRPTRTAQLSALRQQIRQLERQPLPTLTIPVLAGLDTLFLDGGLKPGGVYELSPHTSLIWTLLAEASAKGHWVATLGMDHLGFHAAKEYGVNLERLIVLPRVQHHWWSVLSALVDVVSIVAVSPEGPLPSPHTLDTLVARARERQCALLIRGQWPHSEGLIGVEQMAWVGLDDGSGVLSQQRFTVCHTPRRAVATRRVTLLRDGSGVSVAVDQLTALRRLASITEPIVAVTDSFERQAG